MDKDVTYNDHLDGWGGIAALMLLEGVAEGYLV